MRKNGKYLIYLATIFFLGCGYTTLSNKYEQNRIYIFPAKNNIDITAENKYYSNYKVMPLFLEKRLTNAIINRFNIESNIKVVANKESALRLESSILDYQKEALRYSDTDDIKEQRLRLKVHIKLTNPEGKVLKEKDVVGETSFFLIGPQQKSESKAQDDLIDDVSRRIVEAVVEEW